LVSRLIGEKEVSKIVALVRNPEKARDLAARVEFREKLEFIQGDLMHHNYDFGNIDVVIHLAWLHDPDMCENNSGAVFDNNIGGIQRIVQALWKFRVPYFIFTSQRTVYGKQDTRPVHEDLEPKPNIAKGFVTYAGEVITKTLADSPTRFAILRLTHIYGVSTLPSQKKMENDITDKFARASCAGGNLTVYGDGNQRTHLVHVRDVGDCIHKLLISSEEAWNETYNVAGARDISINELAETYIKAALAMGLKAPTKIYVETEHYLDKAGLASIWLDISKAQKNLGWTPSISIEEGVKELIKANLDR
jgi:UDP-glucose 4-epimerase